MDKYANLQRMQTWTQMETDIRFLVIKVHCITYGVIFKEKEKKKKRKEKNVET